MTTNKQEVIAALFDAKTKIEKCIAVLSETDNIKHELKAIKVQGNYVLSIVNQIKDCDESDLIAKKILDGRSLANRVLLPFYICYKYFPSIALTSGDVTKVTLDLRIGVKQPNVSRAITKDLVRYLQSDGTRIKGKLIRYTLNRKGAVYFETLLNT